MQKNKKRKYYIAGHIIAWILLSMLPFYFNAKTLLSQPDFVIEWFKGVALNIFLFYIFYGFVNPRFLNQKKLFQFIGISLFVILLYAVIKYELYKFNILDNGSKRPVTYERIFTESIVNTIFAGLAIFLSLAESWFYAQQYQQQLEKEKLESELKMLRFQINPHFLFNTLNNIHTLVYKKSDDAPSAVMKLSGLMRYMLYESDSDFVPLLKELEYIGNFVELQKLRLTNSDNVTFMVEGNPENKSIAPLLIVPFIENAFKHGILSSKETYIDIKIYIYNNSLNFICINKYTDAESTVNSGVGLENVKKRLTLQYPDKHHLQIDKSGDFFNVKLQLSI
ncbi:MAG: histidine kinase [Bacteroidales bacterium]|nr:MAG: histidine kinase [Bacteroidales bacterium]